MFERLDDGTWFETKLVPSDAAADEYFGRAVAIDGDRVAVTALGEDGNGNYRGSAYAFRREAHGTWSETKLVVDDLSPTSGYGASVAIAYDRVVVGAIFRETVYVHDPADDGGWTVDVLEAEPPLELNRFGSAVALSGSVLVVGTELEHRSTGAAYVFDAPRTCRGLVATIIGRGHVVGTVGPDVIIGSRGVDRIDAGGGDDVVCALDGDDVIRGMQGNDRLVGGPGADVLRGGSGVDTADYAGRTEAVRVVIDDRPDDGASGEGDLVDETVENVIGTRADDFLVGSRADNRLEGRAGDDVILGGAGDDFLAGNSGDDRLIGGPGDDDLAGWSGVDTCRGSAGLDRYFDCELSRP